MDRTHIPLNEGCKLRAPSLRSRSYSSTGSRFSDRSKQAAVVRSVFPNSVGSAASGHSALRTRRAPDTCARCFRRDVEVLRRRTTLDETESRSLCRRTFSPVAYPQTDDKRFMLGPLVELQPGLSSITRFTKTFSGCLLRRKLKQYRSYDTDGHAPGPTRTSE